jgi:hypothetical protein
MQRLAQHREAKACLAEFPDTEATSRCHQAQCCSVLLRNQQMSSSSVLLSVAQKPVDVIKLSVALCCSVCMSKLRRVLGLTAGVFAAAATRQKPPTPACC